MKSTHEPLKSLNRAEGRRLNSLESTVGQNIDGFHEVQQALMAYYRENDPSVTATLALMKRWDAGERMPSTMGGVHVAK